MFSILSPSSCLFSHVCFYTFALPLQVFKCETFAYNASNDVIQAEQAADTQLKLVVQEWEATMETFKVAVEQRVADELSPTVYPQVGWP